MESGDVPTFWDDDSGSSYAYETGNSYTGGYTLATNDVSVDKSGTGYTYSDGDGYDTPLSVTSSNTTSESTTDTGNHFTGEYTSTGLGSITASVNDSSIYDSDGTATVTQGSTDSNTYTINGQGNSLLGQSTITHSNGVDSYTFNGRALSSVSDPGYGGPENELDSLWETGTNSYSSTETLNSTNGWSSTTGSGSDGYSLTYSLSASEQSGEIVQSSDTVAGTDQYTSVGSGNAISGWMSLAYGISSDYTVTYRDALGDTTSLSYNQTSNAWAGYNGTTGDGDPSIANRYLIAAGYIAVGTDLINAGTTFGYTAGGNEYPLPVGTPLATSAPGGPIGGASEAIGPSGPGPAEMQIAAPSGEVASGAAHDYIYTQIGSSLLQQYCFPAGTPIITQRGIVPIKGIAKDDIVLCVPETDGAAPTGWRRVLETYRNKPAELINIHVGELPVIRATLNHPFFVRDKGFIAASELKPGDMLRTADDRWVVVVETFRNGDIEPVFNFCVEDYHTYFAGGVLVHNDSVWDRLKAGWDTLMNSPAQIGNAFSAAGKDLERGVEDLKNSPAQLSKAFSDAGKTLEQGVTDLKNSPAVLGKALEQGLEDLKNSPAQFDKALSDAAATVSGSGLAKFGRDMRGLGEATAKSVEQLGSDSGSVTGAWLGGAAGEIIRMGSDAIAGTVDFPSAIVGAMQSARDYTKNVAKDGFALATADAVGVTPIVQGAINIGPDGKPIGDGLDRANHASAGIRKLSAIAGTAAGILETGGYRGTVGNQKVRLATETEASAPSNVATKFGHGARHLEGTGLSQSAVEGAINQQIQAQAAQGAQFANGFWGRVQVGGQTLEYRAFTLPDGTINIGTYYIP